MYIPSKSLRSKLIRDVSKASSTVIEEWWINVHAFDLAGHRPYLIVFLSPVASLPALSVSFAAFQFPSHFVYFVLWCIAIVFECHVEFAPSTTQTYRYLLSRPFSSNSLSLYSNEPQNVLSFIYNGSLKYLNAYCRKRLSIMLD